MVWFRASYTSQSTFWSFGLCIISSSRSNSTACFLASDGSSSIWCSSCVCQSREPLRLTLHSLALVGLADRVHPELNHRAFLASDSGPRYEAAVKLGDKQEPCNSDSVLSVQWLHFPVNVSEQVFEQSDNVLEDSPFLSDVSGFLRLHCESGQVTIGVFSESSSDHFSSFVNIWNFISYKLLTLRIFIIMLFRFKFLKIQDYLN